MSNKKTIDVVFQSEIVVAKWKCRCTNSKKLLSQNANVQNIKHKCINFFKILLQNPNMWRGKGKP